MIWIIALLVELGMYFKGVSKLLCDNIIAQHMARNPIQHTHTKHIKTDYFMGYLVLKKELEIEYYSTNYQVEDILTKPFPSDKF